jgi:hypothetical protein
VIKRILLSVLLGFVTCESIGAMNYLPYSELRDSISDALSLPGAIISSPFFPQGVHSKIGGEYWGMIAYVGNILFYAVLWFCAIGLFWKFRTRRTPPT